MQPQDPNFEQRLRENILKQRVATLLNMTFDTIEPGYVALRIPFTDDITQQHGYAHAGILATLGDSAGGYAAMTLMPADAGVLSIEFKINLMRPAVGEYLIAHGYVVRAGKQITVCRVDVNAVTADTPTTCAVMQMTLMTVFDREERAD